MQAFWASHQFHSVLALAASEYILTDGAGASVVGVISTRNHPERANESPTALASKKLRKRLASPFAELHLSDLKLLRLLAYELRTHIDAIDVSVCIDLRPTGIWSQFVDFP